MSSSWRYLFMSLRHGVGRSEERVSLSKVEKTSFLLPRTTDQFKKKSTEL